jgi:tRNA(Arg) A34 adenosine deaminase TadA
MTNRDDSLMGAALVEARKSLDVDEFPVGAVVVLADEVVVRAHWKGAAQRRLLDHAEMLALLEAERSGKVSRREERQEATLYTTLEPCALCMAAAMSFLLGRIAFALEAPVDGGTNLPALWEPPNGHPPDGMRRRRPPGRWTVGQPRLTTRRPPGKSEAEPYVQAQAGGLGSGDLLALHLRPTEGGASSSPGPSR